MSMRFMAVATGWKIGPFLEGLRGFRCPCDAKLGQSVIQD